MTPERRASYYRRLEIDTYEMSLRSDGLWPGFTTEERRIAEKKLKRADNIWMEEQRAKLEEIEKELRAPSNAVAHSDLVGLQSVRTRPI